MNLNYENQDAYYHGTAAEEDFEIFNSDFVYLAPDRYEAQVFATNVILSKGKKGTPRVLKVLVKRGKVKNISEEVNQAIFENKDINACYRKRGTIFS